jgi:hypothetical protein
MQATKGAGVGALFTGQQAGKKVRGAVRGRESRQPNLSPVSLRKLSSEYRFRHAASNGCGSAGRQQRVQEFELGGQVGWCVGEKERGAMRGRESRQPNVSPASLNKVTLE